MKALRSLAVVLALSGCVSTNSVFCADGLVCPAEATCDAVNHRCLLAEQIAVCSGVAPGAGCEFRGIPGVCFDGACTPTSCGDGLVTGAEECDGNNLGLFADCTQLGYYDNGPLACGLDCRYDRFACTTGLCGDDVRNGPEVCDGSDIAVTDCLDLDFYESGPVTCNDACSYNTSQCAGYCGDATLNGPEVCEQGLPIVETCLGFGYDRGHVECAQCLPDISSCRYNSWRKLTFPLSTIVRAMHGTSRRDVFAVGTDSAVMRWDGTRWTAMTAAATEQFRAVWALAPSHVIAAGELGTIQRYNGSTWSTQLVDATWRFNAIVGTGASEAFIAGSKGLMRYDGSTWTAFAAPDPVEVTDLWGTSGSDLYVIDVNGKLSRRDATGWSTVTIPGNPTKHAVWGTQPGDVWVAASDGLYQLVGANWVKTAINFGTINVGGRTADGKICIAGTQVWCYDGAIWSFLAGAANGFGDLTSLYASAPDDLFIAGQVGIQHFQGSQWFVISYPTPAPIAWWSDGTLLWGINGNVIRQTGASSFGTFFTAPNGGTLYGIWGSAPNSVFAVGQGGAIQRYNGMSWSVMANSDTRTLHSVWGTSATNIYAAGASGAFLKLDGTWSALTSGTTRHLFDVWGSSATNVFAVGELGTILHYNGNTVTPMGSGTTRALRAVFGFSATNVYAVGDIGTLLHYDGNVWTAIPLGTGVQINDVWGTSPSDIFIAGDFGVMFHFDGTHWSPVRRPSQHQPAIMGQGDELFISISGTSAGWLLERLAPW